MEVDRVSCIGVWSEFVFGRDVRVEFGKVRLMGTLRKTRSNLAMVGFTRWFDQVNSRSRRGRSRSSNL
jgi:hypothetical protein